MGGRGKLVGFSKHRFTPHPVVKQVKCILKTSNNWEKRVGRWREGK